MQKLSQKQNLHLWKIVGQMLICYDYIACGLNYKDISRDDRPGIKSDIELL